MRILLAFVFTLAACGDMTIDPPSSRGPGGGAPFYCPSTADNVAILMGLPLPYPANPANPTPYDPALPPPYFYHPCLNSSGAPTQRSGMACYTCGDSTDYYNTTLPGGAPCTQDTSQRAGGPPEVYVVCVLSTADGNLDSCNPSAWGCN